MSKKVTPNRHVSQTTCGVSAEWHDKGNVNNMYIIVHFHYNNISIRLNEEYYKSPDHKNSTVS